MVKFSAGYNTTEQAYIVGFGFSEENLRRLLVEQQPIHIKGTELNLPEPGCEFIFLAGPDQDYVTRKVTEISNRLKLAGQLNVLNVDGLFYVLILDKLDGQTGYFVIFVDKAYEALHARQILNFRVRLLAGVGVSIKVLMFWGPDEAHLEEELVRLK